MKNCRNRFLASPQCLHAQVAHEHIAGIEVVADVVFSIARFALALLAPVVVAVTDVLATIAAYG